MVLVIDSDNLFNFDVNCNNEVEITQETNINNRTVRTYQINNVDSIDKITVKTHSDQKAPNYRIFKKKWFSFPFLFFLSFSCILFNSEYIINGKFRETSAIYICINKNCVSSNINGYICLPEFIIKEKKKATVINTEYYLEKRPLRYGYAFSAFVNIAIQLLIVTLLIYDNIKFPGADFRSFATADWILSVLLIIIIIINLIHYLLSKRKE